MSVRAYLVCTDTIYINNKDYTHEHHEFLWNNWHDGEIFDVLYPFINDMTNVDCIGTIEIVYEEWERLKEQFNNKSNKKLIKVINSHKDVFKKINSHFKNNDYITIKLY